MVGGNFRLDPVQAAALRVKLPYLERWHAQRGENAGRYDRLFLESGLVDAGKIVLPKVVFAKVSGEAGTTANVHIFNQYVLRVKHRDDLRAWLDTNNIGCEIYYPVPLHKQECLGGLTADAHYPEAEKAADATIALPIYPELTEEMQAYVVEKIVQFYS